MPIEWTAAIVFNLVAVLLWLVLLVRTGKAVHIVMFFIMCFALVVTIEKATCWLKANQELLNAHTLGL